MSLKVLQVTESYGKGGAGLGVQNLQQAFVRSGLDSHVFTMQSSRTLSEDDGEITLCRELVHRARRWVIGKHSRKVRQSYPDRDEALFSLNKYGAGLRKKIEEFRPDIIHLHWINRHMLSIADIGSFSIPIVWTMRDCWPFTGGCHYKYGCDRFTIGCGSCPILGSDNPGDTSADIHSLKLREWKGAEIYPVGISTWLTDQANLSPFFKHPARTVWNSVNEGYCQALVGDSRQARLQLLERKSLRACIVSLNPEKDARKGTLDALDALHRVQKEEDLTIEVSIVGSERVESIEKRYPGLQVSWLGYIGEFKRLVTVYQENHLLLAPSHEEAFGKTIAEAMTQGTPCIVYDGSGPETMIEHLCDGFVATLHNTEALSAGVRYLSSPQKWFETSERTEEKSRENFSPQTASSTYGSLYAEILAS